MIRQIKNLIGYKSPVRMFLRKTLLPFRSDFIHFSNSSKLAIDGYEVFKKYKISAKTVFKGDNIAL